ncbi:MAG TPA: bifunctional hydroxymethylpyrimidine kinase/phosphomethylpyrimidine kinase [Alphaproteobacteria bacterium]|nr:bifunctional hydroxymethylpyrimidine kinase/phosphomethylpyrimidine kinase [Alphaproteobacteria bacterium]
MNGRVLVIAGSDSGGGAGIQADIKTVTALGGYAMTAVTALTAQNTKGVFGIANIEPSFVAQQIELCLNDIGADALKTGMLHSVPVIEAVADAIVAHGRGIPLIADPVMVAKGGESLLEGDAVAAIKRSLFPYVSLLTPNLPEAEALAGLTIGDLEEQKAAALAMLTLGPEAVLLKGGHREGPEIHDVLASADGVEVFTSPRIDSQNTHGTGCTLASAIATGLAQKLDLRIAVIRAREYVQEAIRTAPGYGGGHGPLNHGHTLSDMRG